MTAIGYHASHEQFQHDELLDHVRRAEQRGFDAVGEEATREQVRENVHVSADLDEQTEWIRSLCDLDVEAVYLHNVTRTQTRFVDRFGDRVLPALP